MGSISDEPTLNRNGLGDIRGMVAVVTGGGTGLGFIITKSLIDNGAAKVYITGRREDVLKDAAKQAPDRIIPIRGDVTSHKDLEHAVDVVQRDAGFIDVLVANAGMTTIDYSPDARPKPTAESSISEFRDYYFNYRPSQLWTDVLEVNTASVFTTIMAFLELLEAGNKRRDSDLPTSQIIAIGSIGGLTRVSDSFIYNASKAGTHHLMKNLGNFLAPHGIRTNTIAPGWFPTSMTTLVQNKWKETNGVMPRTLVPQQRMGHPEELAGTVLYLTSKAGGYCNGVLLPIEGGFSHIHAGTY